MKARPSLSTFEVALTIGAETQVITGRAAEIIASVARHEGGHQRDAGREGGHPLRGGPGPARAAAQLPAVAVRPLSLLARTGPGGGRSTAGLAQVTTAV